MTARSNYNSVIAELNQKKQTLDEAKAKLDSYSKFIDANPFFQRSRASLQWEKNDEVWINLSYEELLTRLTDLYRYDRPFVLDFFSASVTASDVDKAGQTENSVEKGQGDHEKQLVFHLQGYFVCPCKSINL